MSPLEFIRHLAEQAKRVNPSALSRPQKQEYVDLGRKVYTPRFLEAQRKEEKWRELASKTQDPSQRLRYLEAARQAEYDAARFSKLDQAAVSIGKVNRWDDEFRAMTVPGQEQGIPGGIATYYPPGHSPEDAMLADSTYLELLGTSPDVKGAGRVLLRQTGLTSPSNPMTWHSTSYPETMGFYESRGAELVPKGQVPKDSAMFGNLPVFRVPRGDLLKEKEGGPVKMAGGGALSKLLAELPRTRYGAVPTKQMTPEQLTFLRRLGEDRELLAHGSSANFKNPRGNPLYLTDDPLFAKEFTGEDMPFLHIFQRPNIEIPEATWEDADFIFDDARKLLQGKDFRLVDEGLLRKILSVGLAETNRYRGFGVGFQDRGAAEIIASPTGIRRLKRFKEGGWIDFATNAAEAAEQLHVSKRDVARGEQIDARHRAELEALRTSLMYPSRENAERLPASRAEQDDALFLSALLRGEEQSMSASPRSVGDRVLEHSPTMRSVKEFYDKRTPGGKRAMWALGLLPAVAAPMAIGVGLPARVATGALLNTAMGVPFAALEPEMYDPSRDALYGAAFGASPLLGGAALGADMLYQGAKSFAGGGLVAAAKAALPALSGAWAPSVVKPKGGNWLTGSVEGALAHGLRGRRAVGAGGEVLDTPLNAWIDGPLTKYVKNRMATPEDEVRRLAEEGVLHTDNLGVYDNAMPARESRGKAGMPLYNTAFSALGRNWEDVADAAIRPSTVGNFSGYRSTIYKSGNEWMHKAPDTTPVYGLFGDAATNLGFDHLVDELSNAMNPESGLPGHLQLSAEAVKNMSMEKAVRRVAEINNWRAEQKVAASQELADKASVIREYTDPALPNPKGLRWVELNNKAPLPEGLSIKTDATGTRVFGLNGEDLSRESHPSAEDALAAFNRTDLEKQLKYEGDTMGHCVSGYCDDVTSGRSRIFSLRDAKGEPHVTVEVGPVNPLELQDAEFDKYYAKAAEKIRVERNLAKIPKDVQTNDKYDSLHDDILNRMEEAFYAENPELAKASSITQIKGKQNRKPNDEYLPFVQDFVKNSPLGGTWGDVGDLENTGLRRVGGKWLTPEEHNAVLARRLPDGRPLLDQEGVDAMEAMQRHIEDQDSNRFASGGRVTNNNAPESVVQRFLALELE